MSISGYTRVFLAGVFAACGVGGGGCDSDSDKTPVEPQPIDSAALAAVAVGFATGDLVQVSKDYSPSQHSGSNVRVWVSLDALDAYRAIDPDANTAEKFPEGAIILKEQLTRDGAVDAYTMMVKGRAGFAPASGDWHWQRIGADGAITHEGQIGFCISCHTPRAEAEWLFGVPAANQTP